MERPFVQRIHTAVASSLNSIERSYYVMLALPGSAAALTRTLPSHTGEKAPMVARHLRVITSQRERRARWCAVVLAALVFGHARAQASAPEEDTPVQASPSERLAGELDRLDGEVRALQRETRGYLYGWLATNAALAGAQASVALTASTYPTRGNYAVGTALAVLGMGLLVVQPWPGLNSHARFRAMPSSTHQERLAKIDFAERVIARQRRADRAAVGADRHAGAALVALASGLGVGIGFDSMREGLSRGLGVLLALELQIVTRPGTYRPRSEASPQPARVSFAPWFDRHARGASLVAQF
jgi:hypothetical protein